MPNNSKTRLVAPEYMWVFFLVTALFLFWGIPNSTNDILIKQFMKSFEINRFQAGLVQFAFYMGYFFFALPAALIMRKYSYKTGLVIGLFLFGIGCWMFYPAAMIGTYGLFLAALFVIASGLAFLETGANPYVAVMGSSKTSEQRLNLAQAFNPVGVVIGVVVGTVFIFSGIELSDSEIQTMKSAGEYEGYLQHEIMRVTKPYMIYGAIVILWAVLMIKSKFPKIQNEDDGRSGKFSDLFKFPHFKKGVLAQFFYVGAQVGTWSFFIQYVQDYTGEPEKVAGGLLTGTLITFGVARFLSTYFMKYIKASKLMGIYSIANIVLVAVGIAFPGWIGLAAVFMTSFFMSLMFPTIFALGLKGLGPNVKLGGSLIVMAIIGGALFPPVMGLVSEHFNSMAIAYIVPLISYIYITYYSFAGSKPSGPLYEDDDDQPVVVH